MTIATGEVIYAHFAMAFMLFSPCFSVCVKQMFLQDVVGRIRSFSEKGPRAVCILSANGSISNATLHQPGSSGGTLTYEV